MTPRLGVNIDHVATLRQARGELYPSVVDAANCVLENGADQITIHLREDRRHIQDFDVETVQLMTKKYGRPLNLEMGCHPEILEVAKATSPEWVCLVPESRQEITTEGGLNILDSEIFARAKETIQELKAQARPIQVSLFVEADPNILEQSVLLGADAIEIHTGDYAKRFLEEEDYSTLIERFEHVQGLALSAGIGYHAGHGLTLKSVKPLLEKRIFTEYNIGHWIIAQSIFSGLGPVVKEMKNLFEQWEVK